MDINELKALGIALRSIEVLEQAYSKHKVQLLLPIAGAALALDLNALPKKPFSFKEVFLRWALQANEGRIAQGKEPLFTMGLIRACPLWKLTKPPIIGIKLDKESLLKQAGRTSSTIGKPMEGAMNRSKGK